MNRFNFLSALLLTAASWIPAPVSAAPDTFGILTNNFFISSPATTAQLKSPSSIAAQTVLKGYTTVAKRQLGSYSGFSGKSVQYGNYMISNVVQQSCPAGTPALPSGYSCHYISCTVKLNYTSSQFSSPPGSGAVNYIQSAINTGGNLDCAFKAATPSTLITSRTGGTCPGTTPAPTPRPPTKAPAPSSPVRSPTPSPVSTPMTVATLTNNWVVANNAGIQTSTFNTPTSQASKQLVAAFESLVKKTLASYNPTGSIKYLTPSTLGTVTTASCFTVDSTYKCNAVPGITKLSYNAASFSTPPGNAIVNLVQAKINNGDLQCELKRLFSGSPLRVITGGGCKQ